MRDKIAAIKEKIIGFLVFEGISKEKVALGACLVLFVGFILYNSLIAAQMRKLKTVKFQFISEQKLMDSYNLIIKNKDPLVTELKLREEKFAKVKEKFISEEDLPNYFTDFRSLIKSYHLEVASLDFSPQQIINGSDGKALNDFSKMSFVVSVTGEYFNAMLLLYELEQTDSIFDKESVVISQEGMDPSIVVMDIKAVIYILLKTV